MASTLLEQTRAAHEEIERLERVITKDFKQDVKAHKDKLYQAHRVRALLERMQAQSAKLLEVYEDKDRSRKEEIAALRGDNVFSNFYDRLKEVRDYHRKYGADEVTEAEDDGTLLALEPAVEFSGEEALGRYLDLHEHFNAYINAKFGRQVDYMTYLRSLTAFNDVPPEHRSSGPYRTYLQGLLRYLESFFERTQPLQDVQKRYARLEAEFDERWAQGEIEGWTAASAPADGSAANALPAPGALDLDAFASVEELEALGAARLKAALQSMGLKCGGTPRQRAERLFATKGKPLDALDPKLFAKAVLPVSAGGDADAVRHSAAAKAAALLEAKLKRLLDVLGGVLADTVAAVEKKQARTYEELLAEAAEAEAATAVEEADSDEEEYIYNPLKIELGWDGKPIPYWLWKLHGMHQEYTCEICGDAVYKGRRAYERHFKEVQHQAGMRALGIPNNKMFFEVTKIADALALWENIKAREKGGFRAETDEEFEDAQGNVYNKKTYEDLKRQGLL